MTMTADELAKRVGVSRKTLFRMRTANPAEAPKGFDDVGAWRKFVETTRNGAKVPRGTPTSPDAKSATASNLTYVDARARRTSVQAEMANIQLEATKRNIINKEEVRAIFAEIAKVVKGRFLKVINDLPCSCVGLTEAEIYKVAEEKIGYGLSALELPAEFFEPQSLV